MTGPPARPRHDVTLTRGWVTDGTRRLATAVEGLGEDALRGPSLLPGWTRAHVVAHVARNAEALGRLAAWARTGVESPMYPDGATREADIERSAARPGPELRGDLTRTAEALEEALDALDEQAWRATVRASTAGRPFRASAVPWLRVREVWLHRVDLSDPHGGGPGASRSALADAPDLLVDELTTDVVGTLSSDAGCPRLDLVATDRSQVVHLGAGSQTTDRSTGTEGTDGAQGTDGAAGVVRGSAVDLLLWLSGRSDGQPLRTDVPSGLPGLPRWL